MQEDSHNTPPDQSSWQYTGTTDEAAGPNDTASVSWQALEFIDHQKGPNWYFGLGIIGAVFAVLVFLISSQDLVPVGVVVVATIAFGIFASRKPRELSYAVDKNGVSIAERLYPFSSFRSFSQVEEDGNSAIWLMPNERFRPIISLYYAPELEAEILDTLSYYLPFELREPGIIDHLMQRIKF